MRIATLPLSVDLAATTLVAILLRLNNLIVNEIERIVARPTHP